MNRRIAMWSGPRNISMAMMRAWGARPETAVCDEPIYAHYVRHTGHMHHPGHEQIIDSHETQWERVVACLTGPLPDGRTVFYQKQMAHHLLPHISLDWLDSLTNVFLIRDPRETLLSLLEFFTEPDIHETGLPQQRNPFKCVNRRLKQPPLVLDARGVIAEVNATHVFMIDGGRVVTSSTVACPEGITRAVVLKLCDQLSIPSEIRDVSLADLHRSDGAFCTGTMGELTPVVEIDCTTIGSGEPDPIFHQLTEAFRQLTTTTGVVVAERLFQARAKAT